MLKAPQKQNATDTINTLASRLTSATLLEDRRASILGLRSFAKQYPASVASGSLRDLIGCLRANGTAAGTGQVGEGDVDTVRIVLETLIMLFDPDEDSPETSDEIRLWMADEFSQRQDNITILLDLLATPDYYARVHSLELLTAISSARLERTQECILAAPLGTARLVGVLDDGRAAVRIAALHLLVDLTAVSQTELQKLIAFEDAYARIFNIVQDDGGMASGATAVQYCLSLLANLIRHSTSNQSLFRESGCIATLGNYVDQVARIDADTLAQNPVDCEKNAWGLLAVLRLFLDRRDLGTTTTSNQSKLYNDVSSALIALAFNRALSPRIASMALLACSDLIYRNAALQDRFLRETVPTAIVQGTPLTNGHAKPIKDDGVPVIVPLLDVALNGMRSDDLQVRHAACDLIKSSLAGNDFIRHHILNHAIGDYEKHADDHINVLNTLMAGPPKNAGSDITKYTIASDILARLVADNEETKTMVLRVSEGDASKGEDVITAVQAISSHLSTCLSHDADPQVSVAYLNFLVILFFESQPAIDDCLAEGSSLLNSLVNMASLTRHSEMSYASTRSLLPGLCALLLGIIYEFSSKDSPIPRRTLQPFLVNRLGRQKYLDALLQLRQHPAIRDFDLTDSSGPRYGDESLFDPAFVDSFKDEFGRLRRVIDKDPGLEFVPSRHDGVDRDILDGLRTQIDSKEQSLQKLQQDLLQASQQAEQAAADQRKEIQSLQATLRALTTELDGIKHNNHNLQTQHQTELQRLQAENRTETERLQNDSRSEIDRLQKAHKAATASAQQNHERDMERLKGQHGASLASERSLWEDKTRKANEQAHHESESKLQNLKATIQARDNELVVSKQEHKTLRTKLDDAEDKLQEHVQSVEQLQAELQTSKTLQSGLQDVNTKAMARVKASEEESKRNESRCKDLTLARDALSEKHDTLSTTVTELQAELEGLRLELAEERKGYGELETQIEALKLNSTRKDSQASDVERLEAELAAKTDSIEHEKTEAQKARTELEDMLMVMADIEAKRDEYKTRLKKHGEVISEDEDDDDDDDDDDNEDDVE